jgi:uncharacterized protein
MLMKKKIRKWAIWAMRLVLLLTALLAFSASQLELDYDFESFFPKNDKELQDYFNYREAFENDNDFMLLGIETPGRLFDYAFLNSIDSLCDSLRRLPNIQWVQSITTYTLPIIGPMSLSQIPLVHSGDSLLYVQDSVRLFREPGIIGNLVSTDGKSICIILKHTDMMDKEPGQVMLNGVDRLLTQFGFADAHKAGKILAQETYILKMRNELILFTVSSFLLVVVFLFFTFRTWAGVWLPVLIILLIVIWVLGFMQLVGAKINLVSTIMPTIMFIVGMSDVVHILSKYIDELRTGLGRFEALKKSIREVGMSTFYTSLTTAVGFLSLLTVSIAPIREFGLFTSAGVLFAFVITYGLLPALLILLPKSAFKSHSTDKSLWQDFLHRSFYGLIHHRVKVLVAFSLISTLLCAGILLLKVNITLLDDIDDEDPLKQSFMFFEKQFSGVRPFEMKITVVDPKATLLSFEVLQEIQKVDSYLKSEYGVKSGMSVLDFVKGLNRASNGGSVEAFTLPEDSTAYDELQGKISFLTKMPMIKTFADSTRRLGRFGGRTQDLGSQSSRMKNEAFKQFVKENTDTTLVQFQITGTAYLLDKNNDSLVSNMMKGLGIGCLLITIISLLIYRNIVVALIALLVNIVPLGIIAGIMGFASIPLQVGTSIIFTIAFGIAVDDTIHFLGRMKVELDKGKSPIYAIKRTFISTGKALIITSLILMAGFLTLIFSDFNGTFYMGLLVSLTLFFALLADLILLPLLLIQVLKRKP